MARKRYGVTFIALFLIGGFATGAAALALQENGPQIFDVSQKGRKFAPKEVTILRGDGLRFLNDDITGHHIMNREGMTLNFSSPLLNPGEDYVHMFDSEGKFTISCAIHPLMKMTVNVSQDGPRAIPGAE